ncbi:hypothetical protein [Methylobacterium sp. Leaf94]|uniref:hypothetical protein n=1 Tax=Methylobacterium sp. Leaf94 TaxID=1736250 RepID=UPI0012E3F954|nr:hypothetical protein [Methylobacterium sp. Leaf94]
MCELSTLKSLSQLTSVMRMDRVLEIASAGGAESDKMKSFLESIWQSYKLDEVKNKGYPIAERPFISPLLWTYFTAYRHILYYPYTLVALGRTGIGADALENKDKTLSIIASVLPHQKDNLDKFGTDLLHHLIDEIDQLILREIERTLTGEDNDKRGMERAAAVITSAAAAFGAASPKIDISMIPDSIAKRD